MPKRLVAIDIETSGELYKDKEARVLCCGAFGDGVNKVFDFDIEQDKQQLRELLADPEVDKIFHNCLYDTTWLYCLYDFEIKGVIHDTMTRASLINEYDTLNLDDCCKRMNVQGKNKAETIEAWYERWQSKMKGCAKGLKKDLIIDNEVFNLDDNVAYVLSTSEMQAIFNKTYLKSIWDNSLLLWTESKEFKEQMMLYNLQDCKATYNLFKAQERYMTKFQKVYSLECRLIPLLLKMKKVGIRFDTVAANKLIERVLDKLNQVEDKLLNIYGITGEMINSSKQLGARLNQMGIYSPVITKTGAQSWGEGALMRIHNPVISLIFEYKNYYSILHKFLIGSLTKSVVDGRIHCTFLPMLREVGGTVTGRFSCRDPNLQQIPARNKGHGEDFSQDMRALFLPEKGQMLAAMDYGQIEARLLAHFAKGSQAEWFKNEIRNGADMHNIVQGMTGIEYRPVVKTFNFGCIYGMGWRTAMEKNYTLFEKLAKEKNEDIETFTQELFNTYHTKFPVVRDTMTWCQNLAKIQGYVDTIGGRRLHKPKPIFDPSTHKVNDFIYKMLNKLIQGTAADILKQALISAYEEGIYDTLTLHLLVHDEQVCSVPFNAEGTEAAVRLQEIMTDTFSNELTVPLTVACELGPNWGYWSGDIFEQMQLGNFDPEFFKKDYKETH